MECLNLRNGRARHVHARARALKTYPDVKRRNRRWLGSEVTGMSSLDTPVYYLR